MLGEPDYTINELFAQLGLNSSDEAIDQFIANNQLTQKQKLTEADIWNDSQRQFLQEEWKKNAVWVEVIEELNARLHANADNQV